MSDKKIKAMIANTFLEVADALDNMAKSRLSASPQKAANMARII